MKIHLTYRERMAGLFVVMSMALVIVFVVGAAIQNKWFSARVTFHTYVMRGEGLRPGSPVLLSGIEVGEIGNLTIMDDNRIDVELVILEEHAFRVQRGSKAVIRRLLGIGEKRIQLEAPPKKSERLPPGATIAVDEPLDILDAMAEVDLGNYLETMDRAVNSMEVLLKKLEENNRMERMVEAFDQIGPTMEKVNYLLGEINEPMADLIKDPALKRTFHGADKVFNDPNMKKVMRNMSKTFEPDKVLAMIDQLNVTAKNLDRMVEEGGDLQTTLSGANRLMNDGRMDRMLTSMDRLTDAEKLEGLIGNMAMLASQMAKIGPEIPAMSREMVITMRELSVVLKALQKTWLLDDEAKEVRKKMKKEAAKKDKKEAETMPAQAD